jgi:hypothetical protein
MCELNIDQWAALAVLLWIAFVAGRGYERGQRS